MKRPTISRSVRFWPAPELITLLKYAVLAELAKAARDGNKQRMIECSRLVAERGKAFSKKLRYVSDYLNYDPAYPISDMSARLEGKTAQERKCQDQMLRVAQGFTNLGMQLKILCSVKAASVETNKVCSCPNGVVYLNGLDSGRTTTRC